MAGGTRTPGIYVTINGQIFQNGADGGQVLAYDDFHNGNQRALPYTFNINLAGGDQLAIVAATNDTVTYQEFSGFFIEPVAVPGRWAFVCVSCLAWVACVQSRPLTRWFMFLLSIYERTQPSSTPLPRPRRLRRGWPRRATTARR